jgi:repressor of nif and glnA expression
MTTFANPATPERRADPTAPILAVLAAAGRPLSYAELHARLPDLSENAVRYAVRQASERGLVERVRGGVYRLAPESPEAA